MTTGSILPGRSRLPQAGLSRLLPLPLGQTLQQTALASQLHVNPRQLCQRSHLWQQQHPSWLVHLPKQTGDQDETHVWDALRFTKKVHLQQQRLEG